MIDREDILKLADQVGGLIVNEHAKWVILQSDEIDFDLLPILERFAALVAAAEREQCAKVCDAASEPRRGYGQTDEQWAASTLAERIRARGNA